MALTASDIKARFPELGTIDAGTIDRWLAEAQRSHNDECWVGKSDDGLAYLTAHLVTAFGGSCGMVGAPGPLVSDREGQVGSAWKVSDLFAKDDLGSTPYGRRYLSLRKTLFVCRCT